MDERYNPFLIIVTPIIVKIAYVLRKIALPKEPPKNTLVSVNDEVRQSRKITLPSSMNSPQ
jgi:hypothetical protein